MDPSHPAPHRRARRARTALAAALVAALAVGVAAPVAAQDPPPTTVPASADPHDKAPSEIEVDPVEAAAALEATLAAAPEEVPPSPDDPFVEVVAAEHEAQDTALVLWNTTKASDNARARSLQAIAVQRDATADKDVAAIERDGARAALADERDRLSKLTVQAYVSGGETNIEQYRAIMRGDTSDPVAGRRLLFSQVIERQKQVTGQAEHRLSVARRRLEAARRRLARATRAADAAADLAAHRAEAQAKAQAARDRAAARLLTAQQDLRSHGGGTVAVVPQEVALVGLPRLSAEDLAGWFAAGPYHPRVATPIEDYARWFIEEGTAEGIRGDIAFAQAVLETGGFTNEDSVTANNFSGIGHCDSCASGWTFPSPRLGVRAQIQLLKSYAVRKPEYVLPLVDKRLHGPAGCCQTWGDLTTVWATDPTYGPKVMLLYSSLVQFALDRRARGEGFEPAP